VDTSGSISPELYEQAIAEVQECAQSIKAKVFIGSCDTEHYGFEEYLDGDPLPKLRGGGGTDFDDASVKLDDLISQGNEVKAHVFITDGQVSNWGAEVCPTVWAIHSNTEGIQPPYGELVNIPREG
jgi:predicted metal-dependent peptidase